MWTIFSVAERKQIESLQPHNILHDASSEDATIPLQALPPGKNSVKECTNHELKLMLVTKGASVSKGGKGFNKKELSRAVHAHLLVDAENGIHTVHFNRSRDNNGSFANIDTSAGRTVAQIVDALVAANSHEDGIQHFFRDIQQYKRSLLQTLTLLQLVHPT